MSIKEALERGEQMDRQGEVMSHIEFRRLSSQKASEMFSYVSEEMLASNLLRELEEAIKPDFPDVKRNSVKGGDGQVYLTLKWNFRGQQNEFNKVDVNIGSYPWTDEIVVLGKDVEILSKSQCKSDPTLLEDAIVRGYRKPQIGRVVRRGPSPRRIL